MKKKLISLALALVMCLGLAIPAGAAEAAPDWDGAAEVETYDDLTAALANDEVEKVKITGEVAVPDGETVAIDKPILVGTDGSLSLGEGAVVTSNVGMGLFNFEDSENTWTHVLEMCEAFLLWKDGDNCSRAMYGTLPEDVEAAVAEGKGSVSAMVIKGNLSLTKDFSADFLMVDGDLTVAEGVTLNVASGSVSGKAAFAAEDQKPENLDVAGEVTFPAAEEDPVPETPDEEETPAAPEFTDVPASSPFAAAIGWAVEMGITNGISETSFAPNNTCSRAQIITFLWRASGKPESSLEESPFSDVSADAMNADFYSAILWAAENNMAEGGDFKPNDPCTRAMAVDFIWKAAVKAEDEEIETPSFTDVAEDSPYMDGIAWAVAHEITMGTGDGTTFSPDNLCTRGQIVTFLYRTANTPVAIQLPAAAE